MDIGASGGSGGSAAAVTATDGKEGPADAADRVKRIVAGFKINAMNIRDAGNGRVMWEQQEWPTMKEDFEVQLPKSILSLKAVSREMNFSSAEQMRNFRLVQTISLHGKPVEVWQFDFGFVIPGSTNSWQCAIEAADQLIPAEVLSGNLVIETSFYDGDLLVSKSRLKVFYI